MKEYKSCRTCKHSGKSFSDRPCMMCIPQKQFRKHTYPSWKPNSDLQSCADDFAMGLLEWMHENNTTAYDTVLFPNDWMLNQFKQSRK